MDFSYRQLMLIYVTFVTLVVSVNIVATLATLTVRQWAKRQAS